MGKGRKPTPPSLKVLSGTDRPDRVREESIDFDLLESFPAAPQHLNVDGVAMWNDLGPQLMTVGILKTVDLYPLQQLCYCWQQHVQKQKAGISITAAEDMALKSLFSEFGMSWNARQKLIGTDKPKGNKFSGNGKKQIK